MSREKFSVSISYPPLQSSKGIPFLAQNRQFQWTNTGNVILPVIPAYAATALKQRGIKVFWDDAIAENISYHDWQKRLVKRRPDLVVIESKTPVIKLHWQIIADIRRLQSSEWRPLIVLMGDHPSALPEESLQNSSADYVITGGDYDFMLLNLVEHLLHKTKLEPGFWYRDKKSITNTGKFALKHHNLDTLPAIDRNLTNWKIYSEKNTNFKYRPGAYIMSARDCWWGRCTFCSWTAIFPGNAFRSFSVKHTVDEIESLVNDFGIREIFDDAGTLPVGSWLKDFAAEMERRGLNKKVVLGCNMRFAALNQEQYNLLAKAGFRFILYGLESANQSTLDRINKNTKVGDARATLVMAKKAGLEPHLTIMIGYPWETYGDALNTLNLARELFRDGLADSLQATIVVPYPGTALFKECQDHGWLKTTDWEDYDMRRPVMQSPIPDEQQLKLVRQIFRGIITPRFIFRKIASIRDLDDLRHLLFYALKFLQKLKDFPAVSGGYN